MCVPKVYTTLLLPHGSNGGGIRADALRQIHWAIIRTPTVFSLGNLRRLGTSEALTTYWGTCERFPFCHGLVIWVLLIGFGRLYDHIYLVAVWQY